MNDRARLDLFQPLPDAGRLALLQRAAQAWSAWLPGWAEELAAVAAGTPGWLPPGRARFAVGAEAPVAERVTARLFGDTPGQTTVRDALRDAWLLCAAATLDATLAQGLLRSQGVAALHPALLAPVLGLPLPALLAAWADNPLRALGLWTPHDAQAPLALQAMQVPVDVALAVWELQPQAAAPSWAPPHEAALARLSQALRSALPLVGLWVDAGHASAAPETLAPRTRRIAAGSELPRELGRCLLADALPIVETTEDDTAPLRIPAAWPAPLLVRAQRANVALHAGARPLLVHRAAALPLAQRAGLWAQALDLPATPDAAAWAQRLAQQLPLDASACQRAATDARLAATLAGHAPGEAELLAAARHRAALRVQGTVDLREARATLADVVLGETAQGQLDRALRLFAAQPESGLRLLLSGPPGTGKTLAAEALAAHLGRDLLTVDAGRVLSKWLGETERNLERAFQAAETARALLFIDEADALFARRTEVKDAHDRYANAETAYLLQRLERYTGVLVLASNARGSIDAAFTRRFDAVVPFDEPDEAARVRLWTLHLGTRATTPLPRAEAIALLARWYPLTGAQVRSACRGAAAEAGDGLAPLLGAIAREFHKAGRAYPGRPALS